MRLPVVNDASPDEAAESAGSIRIDCSLLIPGRGAPQDNATLVATDGKIIHIGPTASLPHKYARLPASRVATLMPGLCDAHVHYLGMTTYSVDEATTTSPALAGARCARDIAATLNAGYTFVRELAGYGAEISRAIDEGWLAGPRIASAVAILSTTAGHGDARSLPESLVHEAMCTRNLPLHIVDGVDECVKGVRTMLRRGAQCIKVATSGGVASSDDPWCQQFSLAEVKAIVDEADRWDCKVAAHCHGGRGVQVALEAGVGSIEHGTEIDDECVRMMKAQEATLVATRSILEFALAHPEAWTPEQRRKVERIAKTHWDSYTRCIEAGVKIALGTDLGVSTAKTQYNHGMNGGEFAFAVKAGLTPLEAIEAGTVNVVETLGKRAPKKGLLKVGWDADFIEVNGNPLDDIKMLAGPENVTRVWKDGVLLKSPGRPIGLA